jgi:hypothetical protein
MRTSSTLPNATSSDYKETADMSTHATGAIETKSWEEKPYAKMDGTPKLVRASGANSILDDDVM